VATRFRHDAGFLGRHQAPGRAGPAAPMADDGGHPSGAVPIEPGLYRGGMRADERGHFITGTPSLA